MLRVEDIKPVRGKLLVEDLDVGLYELGGGLVMPATIKDWVPPQQGKVVAAGEDVGIEIGKSVLFGLGLGEQFVAEDRRLRILSAGDLVMQEVDG